MAYQWFDSFSRYGTGSASRTAMLDGLVYGSLNSNLAVTTDPDPSATGRALSVSQSSSSNADENDMRVVLSTPVAGKVGVHARFWFNALPNNDISGRPAFIMWRTAGNDNIARLLVRPNGSIICQNSTESGSIADSVVPLVTPSAWTHIEAWYDSSDGTGEVWINGVKKMDIAGGSTGTTALICHAKRSGSGNDSPSMYMKDYGVWDENGTENNTVQGTVLVGRIKPDADVTLGDWVPSTGSTGYNLLAKDAVDDTTYLSGDDAPPAAMQFNFEAIDPDATSVRAVMSVGRMRKIDGGDATVQMSVSPNGTDWDDGADRPITSAFTYWYDISEVSPDTTDPWTPTELNNIVGQVNRTT